MKARWRIALPLFGLVLFAVVTCQSIAGERLLVHNEGRYFWWSGMCLNSDPLNKRWKEPALCECSHIAKDCVEPISVDTYPSWVTRCLMILALPAFLVSAGTVQGMAHLGISEVVTFMTSMPLLICAWFYSVGWFFDRRKAKHSV
jgi:hypothetical protein